MRTLVLVEMNDQEQPECNARDRQHHQVRIGQTVRAMRAGRHDLADVARIHRQTRLSRLENDAFDAVLRMRTDHVDA
jgi:hypothetical protein